MPRGTILTLKSIAARCKTVSEVEAQVEQYFRSFVFNYDKIEYQRMTPLERQSLYKKLFNSTHVKEKHHGKANNRSS